MKLCAALAVILLAALCNQHDAKPFQPEDFALHAVDMPILMVAQAVAITNLSLTSNATWSARAEFLKDSFNSMYGAPWACIMLDSAHRDHYGSSLYHADNHHVHFTFKEAMVELFKTAVLF
ncbi:hypothetical protein HDE_04314 [Halotydeus destructor]|nr:hypothetical protein HDE_04314 [Halotydeus destructor]